MYGFMGLAVLVSAVTSLMAINSPITYTLATNRLAYFGMIIAQFLLVFLVPSRINKSPLVSIVSLIVYAIFEGFFFSILLLAYAGSAVVMSFVAAAGVFIVLAVMGTITKRDLSKIGNQALAALIALIVVSVINLFLQSTVITFAFSFIGVIIFTALTAYDAQKFKMMFLQYETQVNETSLAVSGALSLYLDFVNLFIQLLQIFTGLNGNRD
ncbi:integral membrane protein, interacts with ftsh [Ligilactobacillus hayakitensis DSM 18933 = JCM 14209]|uniref:Integral membrane protein, interacts with ftsh n=2 Tax=Ligilactobacillus TaxID=2767887 RepID=A0A0R1WUU0_9LACO|nr:integral membrane protein, interacts with ftsh [Ligilactobacillus hayakitensis DSM 18933 = JCM 14209]